jgi:hypothetical protein
MIKKILIAFAVILLIIQFIRPEKNIAAAPSDANIATHYATPDNVKKILERSCNDCHTNTTKYPWYASIQPIGWWLADHVKEGKSELNFDAFMTYEPKKARHKMEEVNEMVKEGEMPLSSYTIVHREAKLTEEEKLILADWAVATMKAIEAEHKLEPEAEKH